MSHTLFQALEENFGSHLGGRPDLTRVSGILALCRELLTSGGDPELLHNPCLTLAAEYRASADRLRSSLLQAGRTLDPTIRTIAADLGDSYAALAEGLAELPAAAGAGDAKDFAELVAEVEEEDGLLDHLLQEARPLLDSQQAPVCPSCGGARPSLSCHECARECFYPLPADYRPTAFAGRAHLPDLYVALHRTCSAVREGRLPLESLARPCEEVARHLESILTLANTFQVDPRSRQDAAQADSESGQVARLLHRLEPKLREALAGVRRIREFRVSRRLLDLVEGWANVFEAAVVVEEALYRLRVQLGYLDPSTRPAPGCGEDLVTLSA